MQQVLNNLVGNAIKFNKDKTRITVECYYIANKELIQVSVTDNGVPISNKDKSKLFKQPKTLH